jgi:hypothetical protein
MRRFVHLGSRRSTGTWEKEDHTRRTGKQAHKHGEQGDGHFVFGLAFTSIW